MSGESRDDGLFGKATARSNGGTASAGEVVAVGASDAFDDAELAQTGELSREGGGRALGEQRPQVGAAQAGDVEAGTLQGREQALLDAAEKVDALEIAPIDGTRLGEPIERADAGREIVQTGEVFEITTVATGPMNGLSLRDLAADDGPIIVIGHDFDQRVARMVAALYPDRVESVIMLGAGGKVPMRPGRRCGR